MTDRERFARALRAQRARARQPAPGANRIFTAMERWTRGCQNQWDMVLGLYDEIQHSRSYPTSRVIPDLLTLSSSWYQVLTDTCQALCAPDDTSILPAADSGKAETLGSEQ